MRNTISWIIECLLLALCSGIMLSVMLGCQPQEAWPTVVEIVEPAPKPKPVVPVVPPVIEVKPVIVRPISIKLTLPTISLAPIIEPLKGMISTAKAFVELVPPVVLPEPPADSAPEALPPAPRLMGRTFTLACFTQAGCPACVKMKPVWAQLAEDGYQVEIVDIDSPPEWAKGFTPSRIPVTAIFESVEGKNVEVKNWVGITPIDTILDVMRGPLEAKPELSAVFASYRDPQLDAAAEEASQIQADKNRQGHHDWSRRWRELRALTPYREIKEICAESWDNQRDAAEDELWLEAVKCWRQSPGHWSVASVKHQAYGRGFKQGSRGIWYMTIITGDVGAPTEEPAKQDPPPQPSTHEPATPPAVDPGLSPVTPSGTEAAKTRSGCAGGVCPTTPKTTTTTKRWGRRR